MKFNKTLRLLLMVALVAQATVLMAGNAGASVTATDHDVGWQSPDLCVPAFISPAVQTLAPHAGKNLPSMPLTAIVRENEPPCEYWVGGDTKARLCGGCVDVFKEINIGTTFWIAAYSMAQKSEAKA